MRTNELVAAESGMQFIRSQLVSLNIPYNTPQNQLVDTVWAQLQARLNGTANMNGKNPTRLLDASNVSTFYVPGITSGTQGWMQLDNTGTAVQATLVESGNNYVVTVTGRTGGSSPILRRIQMTFGIAANAANIFNYGVASRGSITMAGNTTVSGITPQMGSVLSATAGAVPLTMTGTPSISGDFSYSNGAGTPSYGAGRISGYTQTSSSFYEHIHAGVTPPEFPVIDTTPFTPYVPSATATGAGVISTAAPAGKNFSNIRIKANANPVFTSNSVFKGVVYIESPNRVSFAGNTTIQGVIAVANNPTGTYTTNTITFAGNVTASGVESLDPAVYGNLTQLKGSMILAPKFGVSFAGNFGTVAGSIISDKITFSGNAGGTIKGSVITLADTPTTIAGNTSITISSQGTSNYPSGVYFGNHYSPLPSTYNEVP